MKSPRVCGWWGEAGGKSKIVDGTERADEAERMSWPSCAEHRRAQTAPQARIPAPRARTRPRRARRQDLDGELSTIAGLTAQAQGAVDRCPFTPAGSARESLTPLGSSPVLVQTPALVSSPRRRRFL